METLYRCSCPRLKQSNGPTVTYHISKCPHYQQGWVEEIKNSQGGEDHEREPGARRSISKNEP